MTKYLIVNPQDGQRVAAQPVPDDYPVGPGEVLLEAIDYESNQWGVWDAATGHMRPMSEAEVARAAAATAAKSKLTEFFVAALREWNSLNPETHGDYSALSSQDLAEAVVHIWMTLEAGATEEHQGALDILTKFRRARTKVSGMAQSGVGPDEIRAETWEVQ